MKKLLFVAVAMMSLSAFAQRYEFERQSKSFAVTAATTSKELNFQIPVYRIDEKLVLETVACRVPQCQTEVGDGSEGNWQGFFNVPQAQKPAALAAAIKGIGVSTAEKIVNNNLLMSKPNSWSDFNRVIRRIEKQLEARGFQNKFATQVLEVYGYENMINLGYGSDKTCRYVDTYCDQVSLKEFRTLSHYIPRNLSVDIKNQSLQSFEQDTITVSVGTENSDIRFSEVGYNTYTGTIYQRGSILELEGKRAFRPLPVREVSTTLYKDAKNNFSWTLSVPAKFINEDKAAEIEVTYELCRDGLLLNCSTVVGGPWKEKVVNGTITRTIFTNTLITGKKYFVRARLNKVNSLWYSNGLSEYVQTEKIKK